MACRRGILVLSRAGLLALKQPARRRHTSLPGGRPANLSRGGHGQMSISRAVHDIEVAANPSASSYAVFRARQHRLDGMVGEVEQVIMDDAAVTPADIFDRSRRVIAEANGKVPAWMTADISPTALLDRLLVAEGRLRRRYYGAPSLDLDESA